MNNIEYLRIFDNGGRRIGIDRRIFTYSGHIPERRELKDRRIDPDRRSILNRRTGQEVDKKFIKIRLGQEETFFEK